MINRISHIGIVVNDLNSAVGFWSSTFGLKKYKEMEIPVEGIRSVFLSVGGTSEEMTIELMEPMDKSDMNNAVARRLAKKGEGFYHLAVQVADIQSSGQSLAEQGLAIMERGSIGEQYDSRWLIHPRDANGVMVEGVDQL